MLLWLSATRRQPPTPKNSLGVPPAGSGCRESSPAARVSTLRASIPHASAPWRALRAALAGDGLAAAAIQARDFRARKFDGVSWPRGRAVD